jgi:phosphosulfolactate synthase
MKDLLDLPGRTVKPRENGLTHVLDRGLSVAAIDGLMEIAGDYIDIVKLGWGTAVATGNLEAKVARYKEHGVTVMFGGTLTELAIAQNRLDRLVAWLKELRIEHIELSDGTLNIEFDRKLELITRLAEEFTVLSEVGSKDDTRIMAPYRWVEQMQAELEAGAWKVIAEGRESGAVGIFRHDGEVRQGLVDEILHAVPGERIMFDAPRKDQQVWFVRRLGPDVNLGNVTPEDVLSLETIRVGLRSDTAVAELNDLAPRAVRAACAGAGRRAAVVPARTMSLGLGLDGIRLARHGETNDNVAPYRFQGWADTPLNDTGRRQAHELADAVAGDGIASLWASDLSRARETAEIVGERIEMAPMLDARLREGARGRWEGFLMRDIERAEPERYAAWRRAGADFRFPDGESLLEHQQRVTESLREIHATGPLPALVVCHGGSIRVMLCAADPRGLDAFHTFEVPNVAVVAL